MHGAGGLHVIEGTPALYLALEEGEALLLDQVSVLAHLQDLLLHLHFIQLVGDVDVSTWVFTALHAHRRLNSIKFLVILVAHARGCLRARQLLLLALLGVLPLDDGITEQLMLLLQPLY